MNIIFYVVPLCIYILQGTSLKELFGLQIVKHLGINSANPHFIQDNIKDYKIKQKYNQRSGFEQYLFLSILLSCIPQPIRKSIEPIIKLKGIILFCFHTKRSYE